MAAALESSSSARDVLARKDYDRAAILCKEAQQKATTAEAAVAAARRRHQDAAPILSASKEALDHVEEKARAGRALLDVVAQPVLDEKLRAIVARHQTVMAQSSSAQALLEGSGWAEELAHLTSARDAAVAMKAEADALFVDIRRGATTKCRPRNKKPLFFGARARSHDGFAVVESGGSEQAATGFVSVVRIDDSGACLHLSSRAMDDAAPLLEPTTTLTTWRVGGLVPVRLLFAWNGRTAWFFGDAGRWDFDAAKVAGFATSCEAVSCGAPQVAGDHIDVRCTCTPKPGVENLELARDVRFSWHGNTVLAER